MWYIKLPPVYPNSNYNDGIENWLNFMNEFEMLRSWLNYHFWKEKIAVYAVLLESRALFHTDKAMGNFEKWYILAMS